MAALIILDLHWNSSKPIYVLKPFARMSHTIKYFTLFDFDVLNIKLRFIPYLYSKGCEIACPCGGSMKKIRRNRIK